MPRLYLATAYMSQYIPGAISPENVQLAKEAKEEFQKVLEKNPSDTTALASLASLSYQQAKACRTWMRSSRSWTKPRNGTSS